MKTVITTMINLLRPIVIQWSNVMTTITTMINLLLILSLL